jgi:hypothetical protein
MIFQTNRNRRRLERERRAIERPQPSEYFSLHIAPASSLLNFLLTVRRIPPPIHNPPPQHPKAHYVCPELSMLSSGDIANELDFLVQNRRMGTRTADAPPESSAPASDAHDGFPVV